MSEIVLGGGGRILVTGATGFVGRALLQRLATEQRPCSALSRSATAVPGADHTCTVPDQADDDALRAACHQVDAVVHLAARVHVMRETTLDPLAEFRRVNVSGTLALARAAAAAGVRRFLFLSSVKVNGEGTAPGQPYRETDQPTTTDPYGLSKLEAEQGLLELAASAEMEIVVLRLPLVYGPGVRANFRSLMAAVRRGIPLPLGAIDNRRSMVGLDNLTDVIFRCLDHPRAAGETFLVSDGDDLSTPDLVRRLARAMNRRPRLITVPVPILAAGATLLGRREVVRRLTDSLQVDITKARTLLDWSPPCTVDEQLQRTVVGG